MQVFTLGAVFGAMLTAACGSALALPVFSAEASIALGGVPFPGEFNTGNTVAGAQA